MVLNKFNVFIAKLLKINADGRTRHPAFPEYDGIPG